MASLHSIDIHINQLFNTLLADVHRLKTENSALLGVITEKEKQIVALQDELHRLQQSGDGTESWIHEEEEYVALIKSLLK